MALDGDISRGHLTRSRRSPSASRQVAARTMRRMNPIKSLLSALLLSLLALAAVTPTVTAKDKDKARSEQDAIRDALQRGDVLPLAKVLAIAGQQVPGDVVEVELEHEKSVLIYEIKILTANGRVREIKIDARTGTVLTIEDD
jgi:uncharacterized membrane protein YkoI